MNHLNKVKQNSNMYQNWITDTWNPMAGACKHNCSYCQVQKNKIRYEHLNKKYSGEPRFEQSYLKDDLGSGKFIFVCNQQDLFAKKNNAGVVHTILDICRKFDNKYLFQTKNPNLFKTFYEWGEIPKNSVLCTTLETNKNYWDIIRDAPTTYDRAMNMAELIFVEKYVTIEPILDFDLKDFVDLIRMCKPKGVFIGADSKHCNLPEPLPEKVFALITELKKFTNVIIKDNLKRIVKI